MNLTINEKGAPALVSTLDARLNLFYGLVRGANHNDLLDLFKDSWNVNKLDTLKIVVNARDCRGGKGDHNGPLFLLKEMSWNDDMKWWLSANLAVLPEYGSFLDWIKLWHSSNDTIQTQIMDLIIERLDKDLEVNSNVSLLAKWLPSENSQWDSRGGQDRFVLEFCKIFFKIEKVTGEFLKRYRKNILVPLRAKIDIVESLMCAQKSINFEKVPSLAMSKYRKAFLKKPGFSEFIENVINGTAKIKASQLYPHDLVRHYLNGGELDLVVEEQWKVLKAKVQEKNLFDDTLIVCDVSGSMNGTPLEVAIALGLLGNRQIITFSEVPVLHQIQGETLKEMVLDLKNMHWGYNTNFERVMDIALGMSKIIRRIIVFSDMQFDTAFEQGDATHFEIMRDKFALAGLEMPQIVFWNLRGSSNNVPVTCDDKGVILMSGYSIGMLEMILNSRDISPLEGMFSVIRSPRYNLILEPHSIQDGHYNHWSEDIA